MLFASTGCLASLTAVSPAFEPTGSPSLVGAWKLVSIEMKGKTQAPGKVGLKWNIEEDSIRIRLGSYPTTKHACVIDESTTPHQFSWTLRRGKQQHTTNAIYEFDGDTLKVCTMKGGKDRPTSFDTEGEDNAKHEVFRFVRDNTE